MRHRPRLACRCRAGVDLVGIDRSAPMLERAQRACADSRGATRAVGREPSASAASRHPASSAATSARLPFAARAPSRLVLAPYGILQSLLRRRDLDRDARVGGARARARRHCSASISCPTCRTGASTANRVQLRGRAGRRAPHARRVGAPGSRAAVSPRSSSATSSGAAADTREHRFDLTFRTLSVPADDAAARTRRISRRRRARRLPRRGRGTTRADVWIILAKKG